MWKRLILAATSWSFLTYGREVEKSWQVKDCKKFAASQDLGAGVSIINATSTDAQTQEGSDGRLNKNPFCRIFAEVEYEGGNTVIFESWFPPNADHNERFLVLGNGGMAGVIDEANMVNYINSGFAVAAGDGGHRASENNNGEGGVGVRLPYLHDLNQVKAWLRNSIAYFTPHARALSAAFYGRQVKKSYYFGCSTGGGQGFHLAKNFPDLFDGIVAGCPGNYYSHLILSFLWTGAHLRQEKEILPQSALDLITETAVRACDEADGVKDGVIENPLACKFDIASLECPSSHTNTTGCLTSKQVAAAQKIYAGPHDTRTNNSIYPGFSVGSETEWSLQSELADSFSVPILQNLVYDDLTWDGDSFDWGSDVDMVKRNAGIFTDMTSPDLSAFKAAGGKMIVLQSWADPYNAATWPIDHLREIERYNGGPVGDWFNLFMVPGGGHCGGASNYTQVPGTWHAVDPLVHWVETGERPSQMLATGPADGSGRTRKLCPWPQTAKYQSGHVDDWSSYQCD